MRRRPMLAAPTIAALLLCSIPADMSFAQSATSGGGGGGTTPTTTTTSNLAPTSDVASIAAALTATGPANTTATINASTGGVVVAGNVAFSFPPGAFGGVQGNVTVSISTTLPSNVSIAGLAGNVLASPNGTVLDLNITDASGNQVTSFATPVLVVEKPNAADLAMANGDFNLLTVVYFVAPNTTSAFNPLGLPTGTALFQPNITRDPTTGSISFQTQNGAGVVEAVVANPVSWVQTLNPDAAEYSGFDPASAESFGTKPQFSYLQVTAPQIPGFNRLVVLDPVTGNYSYVNATDVAPSGPPPGLAAASAVGGLAN